MAKFLKVYCHGTPCGPVSITGEVNIQGNSGILTGGVGTESEGYHLINLDKVIGVDMDDPRYLSLILKTPSISPEWKSQDATPNDNMSKITSRISFVWGYCGMGYNKTTTTEVVLYDRDWRNQSEFPSCTQEKAVKYAWRAHKQLQDIINSNPGNGVIEWVPNDILGVDPNNEEDCNGFELKLLGFVFTNKAFPGE
mgnify:CR=1 FL=1|tara:strand:+ start:408 stop:995 length:588 start_codon:yes stop_codon:yes gene_type:complete